MRPTTPSAAAILALTLTLAGVGCGGSPSAPAYVGQWEAVTPDQGGSFRDRYSFTPDGTYWFFSWWEPLGGGSTPDLANRGTYALAAGTEVAGTLALHQTHHYDFGAGAWAAFPFERTFVYVLDTTVTPRVLRRGDGRVYTYVGPPTADPQPIP